MASPSRSSYPCLSIFFFNCVVFLSTPLANQVVGSILTGGNSTKKEREPRPCRTCERLRAGDSGGSSANSSPTVGWHGGAQDCRGGKGRRGVQGSGGGEGEGSVAEFAPCRHKHVDFAPVVSAVYVPVHSEYR